MITCASFGLGPVFVEPTRIDVRKTTSCIDNIFVNTPYTEKKIINPGYADHKALITAIPVGHQKEELKYRRLNNVRSRTNMIDRLRKETWHEVNLQNNANDKMETFIRIFNSHRMEAFPLIPIRGNKRSWRPPPEVKQMKETLQLMYRMQDSKGDEHTYAILKI